MTKLIDVALKYEAWTKEMKLTPEQEKEIANICFGFREVGRQEGGK